jgi:hypothetical protein
LTALYDALITTGGEIVVNLRAVTADPEGWLDFADGSSRHAELVVALTASIGRFATALAC